MRKTWVFFSAAMVIGLAAGAIGKCCTTMAEFADLPEDCTKPAPHQVGMSCGCGYDQCSMPCQPACCGTLPCPVSTHAH